MINTDGLRTYCDNTMLASWDGEVSAAAVEASRVTLRQLVTDLIEIAPQGPAGRIGELFNACVERFNELDVEHEFICTIEREDICEELYTIGELAGVADDVDEWLDNRDW